MTQCIASSASIVTMRLFSGKPIFRALLLAGVYLFAQRSICQAQVFPSSAGALSIETFARGLDHPWAIAFLPDGRLVVTERPGRIRILSRDGKASPALAGVPRVFASGQGGLLDLVLDRAYAENHMLYFCYAEPTGGGARTAVARGQLLDEGAARLDNVTVIFRQEGPLSNANHFGCRIVQTADSNIFITLGEHFVPRDQAQNLGQSSRQDNSHPPGWLGAGR